MAEYGLTHNPVDVEKSQHAGLEPKWQELFEYNCSESVVKNVQTQFDFISTSQYTLPITINDTEYTNSYVVSPYTALISYAQEECNKIKNPFITIPLKLFIKSLSGIFKWQKINKIIMVNNLLLSTNLYPNLNDQNLKSLTEYLIAKYPDHVIMFRSLNECHNNTLMLKFKSLEYRLLTSRQVYIFNTESNNFSFKNNLKHDLRLLNKTKYQAISHQDIKESDYPRIVELYNKLYLEKYTPLNPQYSIAFIRKCHQNKLFEFIGLRNQKGILDAIAGTFTRGGVTSTPIVGYDTSLSQKLGLYRMIILLCIQRAQELKVALNLSSGVSEFKKLRGGKPYIEYSAVYTKHLNLGRRLFWSLIEGLTNYLARPLLRKYEL